MTPTRHPHRARNSISIGNANVRLVLLAVIGCASLAASEQSTGAPPRLRVTTFNLRYSNPNDGVNAWDRRKDLVVDCIRAANPDLLGTQEGLADQIDFLSQRLPEYRAMGVGRDDGARNGEFSSIFVKKDRFQIVDSGTLWLSETPDKAGSRSWDSSLPRIVTWAKLTVKGPHALDIVFLNSHWDHRGPRARLESAKLMRQWVRKNAGSLPVIVAGDLNCAENSEPVNHMLRGDGRESLWIDGYRELHSKVSEEEATYHAFAGSKRGSRIDFVLHSRAFKTVEATIDRTQRNGRFPSDHFPVHAVLELRAGEK